MKKAIFLISLIFFLSCRGDTALWIVHSSADSIIEEDDAVEIDWSGSSIIQDQNLLLRGPVNFELADPSPTKIKSTNITRKTLSKGEL